MATTILPLHNLHFSIFNLQYSNSYYPFNPSTSFLVNTGNTKLCGVSSKYFLPGLPRVTSVNSNTHVTAIDKDNSTSNNGSTLLFPGGAKYWVVRVDKPSRGVFLSKENAVNYYVKLLTVVLGNEQDAQMCLYHVSWQSKFGFCCTLDDESAQELAAVPGVLYVQPDEDFESEHKDYEGGKLSSRTLASMQKTELSKTKLFITGLSFYTSEKTLRSSFEPFGELVEVKVIMDKISKRSKGYAFVEYSTEEAATKAFQEMNGKIINGWMIVVDRAKSKPRYNKDRSI